MVKRGRMLGKRWWRSVNAPLLAAVLATACAALGFVGHKKAWWTAPGLDEVELSTIDVRFRVRGPETPKSRDIVIVGVDDRTRSEFPEVFQTRRGWAKLIDALSARQPRAIGLDLFFAAPEVSLSPETTAKVRSAANDFRADPADKTPAGLEALAALDAVVDETRGDEELAAAVARSNKVYMGVLFALVEPGQTPAPEGTPEPSDVARARYGEAVAVQAPRSRRPPRSRYAMGSLPPIASAAVGAGSVNVLKDDDGKLRRVPLVIEHAGRFYMPMGLSLALVALEVDSSYVVGDEFIGLGARRAPINPRGQALLSHLGPDGTFPRVSAADVLANRPAARSLDGAIVLVGFTDAARDKVATPFDTGLDGVEIHATLLHNLIHGELLEPTSGTTTLLTILALGGLITLVQLRRIRQQHIWMVGAVAMVSILGYLLAAQILFESSRLIVEVAAPVAATVFIGLVSLTTALVTEGRAKRQLRAAFQQYVSETLVNRIVSDLGTELRLGGERRELTVLFSDIRGFSRFSEKLEPEALSSYLNEYLTPMTDIVMREDGLLDKYIGDAIMAIYGAPLDMSDHASHACRAALAMQARLEPLNASWRSRDLPEISAGVGINTGPMSVGNMGSEMRFDYTVMGDAVNLAARLEGLTKAYGVSILCGSGTYEAAREEFCFRELDLVRVVGREGTARIYELVGTHTHSPLDADAIAVWNGALAAYRRRDWGAAEAAFDAFTARHPDDGPAKVMKARVVALRAQPPGDDWDGVYEQESK